MSEQWGAPEGANDANHKPFDRNALEASLADALKDATAADAAQYDAGAPTPSDPGPARVPNPFGRPNAPVSTIPTPTPAPLPSAPSVPPRTGPSILSGGISAGLSPMGGLGGSTVSGFRNPDSGGLGASLGAAGLGPRPLGPLGGMGAEDPPEPAATITLKRNKPEPEAPESVPAAAVPVPAPAPARQLMPMAGWTPADDDILPSSSGGRRRAKGQKAPKRTKAPKAQIEKAPKEPKQKKLKLGRG